MNVRAMFPVLQWGHGDEAVEELVDQGVLYPGFQRFNGATAMKPWKSRRTVTMPAWVGVLQWGHGDEAVEELLGPTKTSHEDKASMGPRR